MFSCSCFFFSFFGKVPGWRCPAGWLVWELARLAGLAGWLELAGRLGRGAGLEASWLVLAGGWLGWQAGLPDCLLAPERFILHKKRGKKEERFILHKW